MRKAAGLLRSVAGSPSAQSKRLVSTLSMLLTLNDDELLMTACDALALQSYGDEKHLAVLLVNGAIERLVFLLDSTSEQVKAKAARALQRMACASKTGMQALLVCDPLPSLKDLLESEDLVVQREGATLVANIIAFGGPHVQEVLDA
ncbi:unnamed protein product, partial [Effrenium voratum]